MDTEVGAMSVHRFLDEAFAGIDVTPDVQDLKEEIRANLLVRVAELADSGLSVDAAAQRAMAELGDVRTIVDATHTAAGPTTPWLRHRVRPEPAFVVRTVSLAALGVAALLTALAPAVGPAVPLLLQVAAVAVVALVTGVLVADGLRQETTTSYPVPVGRAVGYGLASTLAVAGAGVAALYLRDSALAWLLAGGVTVVVAVV